MKKKEKSNYTVLILFYYERGWFRTVAFACGKLWEVKNH